MLEVGASSVAALLFLLSQPLLPIHSWRRLFIRELIVVLDFLF